MVLYLEASIPPSLFQCWSLTARCFQKKIVHWRPRLATVVRDFQAGSEEQTVNLWKPLRWSVGWQGTSWDIKCYLKNEQIWRIFWIYPPLHPVTLAFWRFRLGRLGFPTKNVMNPRLTVTGLGGEPKRYHPRACAWVCVCKKKHTMPDPQLSFLTFFL